MEDYSPYKNLQAAQDFLLDEEECDEVFQDWTVFEERYIEREVIGYGALKEVSQGYDRRTQRTVAIAKIKPGIEASFDEGLLHEAWLTASLKHPNIIKVYSVDQDSNGRACFTMDLKDDKSLVDLVTNSHHLDELLEAFLKVCDAMAYAHSQATIHLDLKPENIQCSQYGEVLVCDWGLSKRLLSDDQDVQEMDHLIAVENTTLYGEVKGSLGYLAPEQVVAGGKKDHRTDIYALGCVLYYLLTASAPYTGEKKEVLRMTVEGEVIPPREREPQRRIPRVLERITMKAMATRPEDRYQQVEELKADIQLFLKGFPTSVAPDNIFYAGYKYLDRHKRLVMLASVAITLLSVVSAVFLFIVKQEQIKVDQLSDTVVRKETERREVLGAFSHDIGEIAHNNREHYFWSSYALPIISDEYTSIERLYRMQEGTDVRANWAFLNLLQLNFKEVLSIANDDHHSQLTYYQEIAGLNPDYSFSTERRPTVQQVVSFLQKLEGYYKEHNKKVDHKLVGYITIYNRALGLQSGRNSVLMLQALRCINVFTDGFKSYYDPKTQNITVISEGGVKVFSDAGGKDIFNSMSLNMLKLVLKKKFDLSELNHSHIKVLDISHCEQNFITDRTTLVSGLRKVVVRKGQFEELTLRKVLKTNVEAGYVIEYQENAPKQ